ncbi:arsenite-activated ATPase family protein [Cryptosporidium muris RN66]|uniref:ATPase ASNA1 homolog n=1 Tax=Cryptosporidium muris (strain RN66) TaxID=441375 RepID=B6AEX7_CRYMR|nr:arsenite-activated ATPase family protein [Cryptosporidium muris RN66]EEA06744.1 arsenite-activated ATPase family protein [Cryptosporidium muris RN66]|eukprot:XP_002141093.1 arsenite-activated ATPase family protein [Cryptosporidium muris RN66]
MSALYFDLENDLEPSLSSLFALKSLKWIFVGGKGGVGKTTTSCSIASKLSEERDSVLILSTDPAHNLSDAFVQKFGSTPTLINGYKNLYAMELDPSYQQVMEFKLKDEGFNLSKFLPDLLSALPGIDEALSFAALMQFVQTMSYSVIVFDTAPTGHTLRLLSFPSLLEKGLTKLSSLRQKMSGAFQLFNSISGSSLQEDDIHSKLDDLRAITTSVKETFQDASKTSFVCVCIPEFLSVYETERLIQELAKQSIDCSHIVVNQVVFPIADKLIGEDKSNTTLSIPSKYMCEEIPNDPNELRSFTLSLVSEYRTLWNYTGILYESYQSRRSMQRKYLEQIRDLYGCDFHVAYIPTLQSEVRGIDRLKHFGSLLVKKINIDTLLEVDSLKVLA